MAPRRRTSGQPVLSLLGTVLYFSLLGLHRSREVLASFVVQSTVNVAGIAAVWLSTGGVGLNAVLLSTAAGLAASTLYLGWVYRAIQTGEGRSPRDLRVRCVAAVDSEAATQNP